jgi:hypothetical protein
LDRCNTVQNRLEKASYTLIYCYNVGEGKTMKLIDGEHLKGELMKSHSGSWFDIYYLIGMIDKEPEVKPDMSHILLIPAVIFFIMLLGIFLYLLF